MRARKVIIVSGAGVIGLLAIVGLFVLKPKPQRQPAEIPAPVVRVMEATPSQIQITVDAQGTVTPQREIDLVPEVAGKVVEVAPSFIAGGFFKKGDVLIRVDPRDYEFAVTRAEAQLASAKQRLALEEAEAEQARRDWTLLGEEGEPTPLVLREPQLADARAQLDAAQAQLNDAKLDLERTTIRAPFAGRVREKQVDIGQYVTPGARLGRIYSADVAEVRLPLTDRQLSYLGLPLTPYQGLDSVNVIIRTTFAGERHEWQGVINRTEGAIDPRSRVLYAVAEVDDPFGLKGGDKARAPLAIGLFVEAAIEGKSYDNVFIVPRGALKEQDQMLLVDDEERLRFVTVDVLRSTSEGAVIRAGLNVGDKMVTSPLENPVDGMKVRILGEDGKPENLAGSAASARGGRP